MKFNTSFKILLSVCSLLLCVPAFASCHEEEKNSEEHTNVLQTPDAKIALKVKGLSCTSCVKRLETRLKALPGLQSVTITLQKNKASIVGLPAGYKSSQLEAALKESGFEVI